MKAAALIGIRQMEIVNVPAPSIQNDTDVLLKIEKVGVCGSDVHYYETGRIGSQVVQFPFIVGHECSARVAGVGRGVKDLKPGDAVVVEPAMACHSCDQCKAGRENTCRNLKFLGCPGQASGCLCEYLVMPRNCCLSVGDRITTAQGVICEPFAIGVYAVKQAAMPIKANIGILGAGPIGLSCLMAAGARKVNACFVTEMIESRLFAAKKAGAAWVGNPDKQDVVKEIVRAVPTGLDVVFECAGQQKTIDQAIEILKPGGRLMLIGIPRSDRVSFVIDKMRRKEITVVNVRRQNRCTQSAVDLIASGKVNVDFMITHNFDLASTQKAFELVAGYNDGVIKAIIEI